MNTTEIPAEKLQVGDTIVFDESHAKIVYSVLNRHGRMFVVFEGDRPTTASFPQAQNVMVAR